MAPVTNYCSLIKEALMAYVSLVTKSPSPHYDVVCVFDDQHQQYVVRKLGWKEGRRIRDTILHVALRNKKIWIEEDWTEDGSATYFLEHGVPREHIVLGFQPPMMRPYTEFAVV